MTKGDVATTHNLQGMPKTGTRYKLTKNYELVNCGTEKVPKIFRRWNKVDVLYSSVTALSDGVFTVDEDNIVAFIA